MWLEAALNGMEVLALGGGALVPLKGSCKTSTPIRHSCGGPTGCRTPSGAVDGLLGVAVGRRLDWGNPSRCWQNCAVSLNGMSMVSVDCQLQLPSGTATGIPSHSRK
ncbi:hypothetical protein XENTR_v10004841 [Xenopus tropicalis]|nr:hypothetical protein XENTR_v10004841 [Xenopus tropicalis]